MPLPSIGENLAQEQLGAIALGVGEDVPGRPALDNFVAVHNDPRVGDGACKPIPWLTLTIVIPFGPTVLEALHLATTRPASSGSDIRAARYH
jgi:hypothetical protein